jgi:type II secretory pathway predicted ATPase ExeA
MFETGIGAYQKLGVMKKMGGKASAKYQASLIRIHANPFFIDRNNSYHKNFNDAYGRGEIIVHIIKDIEDYITNYDENPSLWAVAIRGEMGSGKSLFSRRLMLEVAENEKTIIREIIMRPNPNFHIKYLTCCATADTSLEFLGVWRPLLRQLLDIYSEFERRSQETIINELVIKGSIDNKVMAIEEIFGMPHLSKNNLN